MNFMRKKLNQKGFTLVELMVVIAILGVLAAIAVPRLGGSTDSAKDAKLKADLRTVESAIMQYYSVNGKYPNDINAIVTGAGKILSVWPKDARGDDLGYQKLNTGYNLYGQNSKNHRWFSPGSNDYKEWK